ncbi:axonemal dynein light chain domain-containing protein 1 [Cygnus atratus]|uniref:axonemal dynein light chain domain-containing protein 1 n=1 Tax=Cygnus atratus TaxID=8868 RepID=UPI0021B763AD|nr:axonemal dynein light chain domain-containing protein 1 [Cygnus atratus]
MPTNEMPAPGPNADGRKMSGPLCAGPVSKDHSAIPVLRGTSRMLDHMRPVSSSLEYSFVPEEIFRTLTCASSSLSSPEYLKSHQTVKNTMGFRQATLAHSLVPKEFHIVKNRGVLPLKYFDEKPAGRLEVIQLMEAMDNMLEKAGVDELIRLHNVLELLKAEQNIYNIVFHELIRQVSVDCVERGHLLSKLRQRYVDLLERIPQQMKTLYKKMMAQQLLDRHITKELLYFKESVEQLTSELYEVREHDRKVTREAEKAQEELAAAMQEAEANANLLEQYRELYELQRRRLEDQVLLVAQERDIWSSAAYDLALKDTRDLADLQEEAEQFREMLGRVGAEIEHLEESSKEKLQIVCRSLNKWLQYRDRNFSSQMNEELLDEIIPDMKILINMLKEDVQQYGGGVYLAKTESLRSAARLQEHWTELGQTVLNRHQDFTGALPPQHAALGEINQSARELYQQYNIRISGNNGTTMFLTALVRSMEDWLFKVQKLKKGSGMHKAELQAFYHRIPSWLAQVDAVMSFIGSGQLHEARNDMELHLPVVPREFFKMIQQWILSMNNEVEKSIMHLNEEVTELHRNQTLWLVNLLRHVTADRLFCECPQQQESETEMDKELRLLSAHKLQDEAKELVAKMCRLSGSIVSSCREIVSAIVRKKRSEMDLEADFELEELNKIKQQPSAGADDLSEGGEATADMIRYVGHDSNIHLKSLKSDIISVTGREMTASKSSTPFSQKEFEALAMLEHLQVQLLETEIRAQNAEERAEGFEKKLGEALEKIQELERELEKKGKVVPEATPKEGQGQDN